MDALSELLRGMRLSGCVFVDAEFTAPWCVVGQISPDKFPPDMPAPAHLIEYHYVVDGEFVLQTGQGTPATVRQGQLLLLPRNDAHVMGSSAGLKPVDASVLIPTEDSPARIRHGGGGERSRILCGYLGMDDVNDPLMMSLPATMQLDLCNTAKAAWIEGSIRHAMSEIRKGGPGAAVNLTKLAEVLFAEAIRTYLEDLPEGHAGWLAGLRDPATAKALALIHSRLDHDWTLEELACETGASRSSLTEKFVRFVGSAPMQYVRRRRMAQAADELAHHQRSIAEIAFSAGYEAEAAFSRAFKRTFGCSPKAFRAAGGRGAQTMSGQR